MSLFADAVQRWNPFAPPRPPEIKTATAEARRQVARISMRGERATHADTARLVASYSRWRLDRDTWRKQAAADGIALGVAILFGSGALLYWLLISGVTFFFFQAYFHPRLQRAIRLNDG